jgi:hypothetical protein
MKDCEFDLIQWNKKKMKINQRDLFSCEFLRGVRIVVFSIWHWCDFESLSIFRLRNRLSELRILGFMQYVVGLCFEVSVYPKRIQSLGFWANWNFSLTHTHTPPPPLLLIFQFCPWTKIYKCVFRSSNTKRFC